MIVTLIGKNVIYKIKLPKITMGNYWITGENNKKLVNIKGTGNGWYISSNNYMKILSRNPLTVSKFARSCTKN